MSLIGLSTNGMISTKNLVVFYKFIYFLFYVMLKLLTHTIDLLSERKQSIKFLPEKSINFKIKLKFMVEISRSYNDLLTSLKELVKNNWQVKK